MDEELCSSLYLDGIITLVDAKHAQQQMTHEGSDKAGEARGASVPTAINQVALADVILLNKVDMVKLEVGQDVRRVIRSINGSAPILETKHSRVDLNGILDLHAYDGLDQQPRKFGDEVGVGGEVASAPSRHIDSSVGTVTIRHPYPVSLQALELFLQRLLWEGEYEDTGGNKAVVLRMKGLVALRDKGQSVIVQGVHDTYDTYETAVECSGCTLVIIGRHLEAVMLQQAFTDIMK